MQFLFNTFPIGKNISYVNYHRRKPRILCPCILFPQNIEEIEWTQLKPTACDDGMIPCYSSWKLKNVFEVSVEIQNAYVIKDTVSPYKKNIFMRV